jgi:Terminase RNaseH-like domain
VPVTYQRPYLYPKQLEAIFCDERFGLIEASTKAGKTVGCIVWLTEQALQGQKGWNYWWIAPSYVQAKIAFTRTAACITPGTFEANKTDLTVSLLNGAIISYKTGEIPDKLYGEDVHAAVVDEASRTREGAWTALRSTITATGGPVRMIGNVRGRKNWFYRMCRVAEKGHPDMHYAKLTVLDAIEAGVFNAAEAQSAREQLTTSAYKELYMAEPSDDGGNPFGGDDAIEACEIPEVLSSHRPQCWGWDLAKSVDWTVGIALDDNGQVCRCYRWQGSWRDTIRRIIEYTGDTPALVDATGVGDPVLEYLQQAAPKTMRGFVFTSKSKQQLMEGLAVAIQRQEIGFIRNPIGLELRQFEYQTTASGVKYGAPDGEGIHDDCVCALALAWRLYKKPAKPGWLQDALGWTPPAVMSIFSR